MVREKWRLIDSGVGKPAWNMAVDEALLRADSPEPLVRIYRWRPAAVSIGYFQPHDEVREFAGNRRVIRRFSGGGAVFHGSDVTFSFVGPRATFGRDPVEVYRTLNRVLLAALRRLGVEAQVREQGKKGGPPSCFDREAAFDIVCVDKRGYAQKLIGSAQRRTPRTLLLHGSIPMRKGPRAGPSSTSLKEQLGRIVSPHEVKRALKEGIQAFFGVRLRRSELESEEETLAVRLRDERYRTEQWNKKK